MRNGWSNETHGVSADKASSSPVLPDSSPSESRLNLRIAARMGAAVAVGLLVANCSSATKKMSSAGGIDPKYGVAASPKVVADGDAVPKGGGREMVGKPYVVAGRLYTPRETPGYTATGLASWYGPSFHGRLTANGEVFDRSSITAAHPTMPLPSYVRVTNLKNGSSIIARVNDRGPYHGGRLLDVSERVAEALDFRRMGTARVKVDYVGRASTAGSDDEKLYATLRTDGAPAQLRGSATAVASAEPQAPVQPFSLFSQPKPAALPLPEPEVAPAPVQARAPAPAVAPAPFTAPVAAASAGTPAPGVPLPPDRPFDLGAAGQAASGQMRAPAAAASPIPMPIPRRTANLGMGTGMFFAEEEPSVRSEFTKGDPLAGLIQQNFVPLRQSTKL
jgi:rare lipoprotein A